MKLFRGRSLRAVDSKGRIMLPTDFRSAVVERSGDESLILTTYDGCIVAFPLPEWYVFEEKIISLNNPSRNLRDFRRLVLGGAEQINFDSQGRMRFSKDHLMYANIEKDAVFVGQGVRFEIWSPERLNHIFSKNYDDVAKELSESDLGYGF